MTTYAVLASGPSMSQSIADSVRGRCNVIAVSDTYKLAPWADVLVASDGGWWRHHKPEFSGPRYTIAGNVDAEKIEMISSGTACALNSGALAIRVAMRLGATEIILLGFDGHGSHFFGLHPSPLGNTPDHVRRQHMQQHQIVAKLCRDNGVSVWNCTEGTAIDAYEIKTLEEVLCSKPEADVLPVKTSSSLDPSLIYSGNGMSQSI